MSKPTIAAAKKLLDEMAGLQQQHAVLEQQKCTFLGKQGAYHSWSYRLDKVLQETKVLKYLAAEWSRFAVEMEKENKQHKILPYTGSVAVENAEAIFMLLAARQKEMGAFLDGVITGEKHTLEQQAQEIEGQEQKCTQLLMQLLMELAEGCPDILEVNKYAYERESSTASKYQILLHRAACTAFVRKHEENKSLDILFSASEPIPCNAIIKTVHTIAHAIAGMQERYGHLGSSYGTLFTKDGTERAGIWFNGMGMYVFAPHDALYSKSAAGAIIPLKIPHTFYTQEFLHEKSVATHVSKLLLCYGDQLDTHPVNCQKNKEHFELLFSATLQAQLSALPLERKVAYLSQFEPESSPDD